MGSVKKYGFWLMASVAVSAAPVLAQEQVKRDDSSENEAIIVTGLRASLQDALTVKKDAVTIVDSIRATDIGKFPDNNVVESMSRIPGIQITRREGEGETIKIRGQSQVKTIINGVEFFGVLGRDFRINDLPSDVIAGIDVYKGSDASLIEGGLGGLVNVRTRRPFDSAGQVIAATVKADYVDRVRTIGKDVTGSGSLLYSNRFETGLGEMGILLNVSHSLLPVSQDRQGSQEGGKTIDNFGGSGRSINTQQFVFLNGSQWGTHERNSVVGSFQWRPADNLELYADAFWLEYIRRVNFVDFRIAQGTPTGTFTTFPGTDDLQSADFTNDDVNSASVIADTKHRTQSYDFGAKWDVTDRLKVNAQLSSVRSSGNENLYEWAIHTVIPESSFAVDKNGEISYDTHGYDINNPANYNPNYLLVIDTHGKSNMTEWKVDASYDVGSFGIKSIDLGLLGYNYRFRQKQIIYFDPLKNKDADGNPITMVGNPFLQSYGSPAGYFVGLNTNAIRAQSGLRGYMGMPLVDSYDETETRDYNGNTLIGNLTRYSGYLDARENNLAGYAKLNYEFDFGGGLVLDGNLGERVVRTKHTTYAYSADLSNPGQFSDILQPTSGSSTYWLPAINSRLKIGDKFVVRGYYGKTLSRIELKGLVGAISAGNPAQHVASRGNPDLKPYFSTNYDISLEYYPTRSSIVYLAGFRKNYKGFPTPQVLLNQPAPPGFTGNDWRITTTINDPNGSHVTGFETGGQMFFDMLPSPFDGLGLQANYTYVSSRAIDLNGNKSQIPGQPKSSLNLIGMYEKNGVSLRLAYTWTDKTINSYVEGAGPNYTAPFGVLDASVSYEINKHFTVGIDATNINDHREKYYRLGSTTNPAIFYQFDRRVSGYFRARF